MRKHNTSYLTLLMNLRYQNYTKVQAIKGLSCAYSEKVIDFFNHQKCRQTSQIAPSVGQIETPTINYTVQLTQKIFKINIMDLFIDQMRQTDQ